MLPLIATATTLSSRGSALRPAPGLVPPRLLLGRFMRQTPISSMLFDCLISAQTATQERASAHDHVKRGRDLRRKRVISGLGHDHSPVDIGAAQHVQVLVRGRVACQYLVSRAKPELAAM